MRGGCSSRLRGRTNSRSGRRWGDGSRRRWSSGFNRLDDRRGGCSGCDNSRRRRSSGCGRCDYRLRRRDDRRGRCSRWDSSLFWRSRGRGGRRRWWNSSLDRCWSSRRGSVDLVGSGARRGSLCKPERAQQGRYNDQQYYSFHGILRGVSPCGGLRYSLGLIVLPILISNRTLARSGLLGQKTWSIQVTQLNLIRYECDCLSQTAHI